MVQKGTVVAIRVGYGRILEVVLMQTGLTRLGCMDLGYILQNVEKMRMEDVRDTHWTRPWRRQ